MERKKITFDSFIRGILVAVVIIGILWLFKRLSSVLLPFFVAWLIAYLIYPLVTFFQHRLRLRNRALAIVCALFSILLVGGLAFYLLVPPMIQEFARVKDLLVEYFSYGNRGSNIPQLLSEFLRDHVDREALSQVLNSSRIWFDDRNQTLNQVYSQMSQNIQEIRTGIQGTICQGIILVEEGDILT